jgi:hypothetical protein
MRSQFHPRAGDVADGVPLRLFEWGEGHDGRIPATHQTYDRLTAHGRPVSELPDAVWTLWMQLMSPAPAR